MATHLALVNGRMRDETSPAHVASDQLAAFLDGRLTGAGREVAVMHFAACADCRKELTELRVTLDTARTTRSRRWTITTVAAAAILAVVLIPRIMPDQPGQVRPGQTRDAQVERFPEGPAIGIISPADHSTVGALALDLTWRRAGVGAMYDVTVQDTSGNVVWSASLSDTSITVPDSSRLDPGRRYFWSVDARLSDGRTAKTGVRSFTVR